MGKKGLGRNAFVKATMTKASNTGAAIAEDTAPEAAPESAAIPPVADAEPPPDPAALHDGTDKPAHLHQGASCGKQDNEESQESKSETPGQLNQRHKREMKVHKEAMKKFGKKRQDEVDRLDKDIRERHATEVAGLEARQAQAAAPTGAGDGMSELAESLSEATLHSNGHAQIAWPTPALQECCNRRLNPI